MNTYLGSLGTKAVTAVVALAAISLAACGGSDEGAGSSTFDLASSLPSAAVCNGEPSEVNPPSTDPISGYVYINGGDGWTTGWIDTFGDQRAIVGDDATTILCVKVTDSTEVTRCPYEDDGDEFELVMVDATYSFSLRNADTANEIARGTASGSAGDCPLSTSWSQGENERTSYPAPTEGDLAAAIDVFFG
jgi:predicted small secreted protein